MADHAAWAVGYARQSQADFQTFEKLQPMSVPECHKLQFLQMACEKLVKSHLCAGKSDPADLHNCEYPWEDGAAKLHVPVDWTFTPSDLLLQHAGRTALKLIGGAIDRLVV
jgi:hypothetical protein